MLNYGIVKLFNYHNDFGAKFSDLAFTLMEDNSLDRSLSEYIAARTSYLNKCLFCMTTHTACLAHLRGWEFEEALGVVKDFDAWELFSKFRNAPPTNSETGTPLETYQLWSESQWGTVKLMIDALLSGDSTSLAKYDLATAYGNGRAFSDNEIFDIAAIVSLFQMANTLVIGLEKVIQPDQMPTHREMVAVGTSLAITGYLKSSLLS